MIYPSNISYLSRDERLNAIRKSIFRDFKKYTMVLRTPLKILRKSIGACAIAFLKLLKRAKQIKRTIEKTTQKRRLSPKQARKQKFFRAGEVLWNQGTSINFSSKTQKKGSAAKNFGAFSPRYSQNYILNGKFNPRMDTRLFFSKFRALFLIFKKGQRRPPLKSSPLVARLQSPVQSYILDPVLDECTIFSTKNRLIYDPCQRRRQDCCKI